MQVNRQKVLLAAASALHWMAYRWVVTDAATRVDAMVFDHATSICSGEGVCFDDGRGGLISDPQAAEEVRRRKCGSERVTEEFLLPVIVDDAVRILHRYARRYADRRQAFAARIVNEHTRALLSIGVDLSSTASADGTLWAEEPPLPALSSASRPIALDRVDCHN